MNILIVIFPIVLLLCTFALSAKFAAFLSRRLKLSWAMSFLYALIVVLISVAVRSGLAATGAAISEVIGSILGIAAQLAVSTWFFSIRATNESGEPAGWRGGLLLAVITLVILVVVSLLLMLLAGFMRARMMH